MTKKEHTPHTTPDNDHDSMTLHKLAEHLGVDLYLVMEIARWTSSRPQVAKKMS